MFVIHSLTDKVNTSWGERYGKFNWEGWEPFIKIRDNRTNKKTFSTKVELPHIIGWLDREVLQQIGVSTYTTIDVRIRIICGMINNCIQLNWQQKQKLMELIWDIRKQFNKSYTDYYCKYIAQVPF